MRGNVKRSGCAEARAKNDDWLPVGVMLQFVHGAERSWRDACQPRRSSATAKAGVIHAQDLDGPLVPHLGLGRDPALRPVGIPVKAQNVDIGMPALARGLRFRCPDFQLAVIEWNVPAYSSARINRRSRWQQNQVIRQAAEKNHGKIETDE